MKSHEQKYAEAVIELKTRLAAWSVPDSEAKAREFMQGMVCEGWRGSQPALDIPATRLVPASPETKQAALDAARAALRAGIEEDA